ncbi:von Willebrand factor [Chelonia mydas]|uniref:von Willebrand factor n=1 Tax=Chelonia mydas TaxID=8469 RepID=M7BMI6_CHEMY|nr:von Willebrand factor [Chelonia mydas]
MQDVMERCQLLRMSSVFSKCHHRVDPEVFIGLCEEDMCRCAQDMHCHCPTFHEYARSCAQQGVIVDGWPNDSSCRPRCPVGMEYKECVSPCVKTCQSLNINEVCQGQCADGCSCPGECSVTGQSHFKSFDNKYFTFSGICQYLFAKDCEENSFSVIIETVQCADDPDAVCTRSASVRLQDMENSIIKMKHGGVISLNGQDVQIPLTQGALRIQRIMMSSVLLTYGEDLQIDWDGRGKLLVKVVFSPLTPPKHTQRLSCLITCGLCGNYNGNEGDDFLTPSGLVEALVEDFGNAWKLNGDCQDLLKQDSDPCSLNPRLAKYAEDSCSILMSSMFEPCHHEVSPYPYLKNCRYDVCSCSDGKDCLCAAVSTYATACARKGVLIEWREPDFCSMTCSEGQIYQQCGTPCNQTCRSLSYPDVGCNEFCMEGCYCPHGQYIDEHGDCVPKSQCSCYYDGEIFQPDDVFSDHYTMCYCENGFMHCTTNKVPGAFLPDVFFDNQPSARIKRSLTCRAPMDKFVCPPNNPRAEGIECTKTCQNYDLECVSHGCISGCLCPKGMVRHENKCVVPEKCPCFHNGREYAKGETVNKDCNTCVCRGRMWDCTDNVCDATCSVIGTAYYSTFDGLKYMFPGDCQYVLVQDYCADESGTFRVLISNEGCGFTGEKCTKKITVLFDNGEIELFSGNVDIKKPLRDETNVEVLKSGRYYILLLGKGISVTWDLAMGVSVILKEHFKDQVCGLCGNFDGIQNNDLTSSSKHLEVDPTDFGNSWKVNPGCADVRKLPQGQTMTTSLCNDNVVKQMMVETSCSILTSEIFKECKKLVNPEPYMDICMYDTCACESIGDCACFCDAIATYAHICAQKGAVVHWRSPTLCPQSCEDLNKHELEYRCEWRYNSCGPACPITCQHFEPVACPLQCVEGCHVHCPEGLCSRPMDIMFLLDGSSNVGASEFEAMKSFVKAFIGNYGINNTLTQVSVLQYARANTLEISWNMPQESENLLNRVSSIQQREQGPSKLGEAVNFAVLHAMSEAHGGRPNASKIAVIIVSEKSEDPVDFAAYSASINRVSLFPIGVGDRYDEEQLRTLAGQSDADRIMKLRRFEDLPDMVTLDDAFVNKLCMEPTRECIDEDGNKRKPGDKWILTDKCHIVTCLPGGQTVLESHRINCEKMSKPTCHNNFPAVKTEETCGCRWTCPCMCMGSSTRHIVTFDGLDFKLTGNCSYTLLQDREHDIEVILHNGACSSTPKLNCMNAIEVKHHGKSIQLSSDMTVAVNGEITPVPYTDDYFEVTIYGAIMHEIRFSQLRHIFTFTPRNNEFTLHLDPGSFSSQTYGLCGFCDQNNGNDFILSNGSVTSDSSTFIQEWTVKEPGKICEIKRDDRCTEHATTKCNVLRSPQFAQCHRIISPDMFYSACEENSCYEDEICEVIASYAHVCRTNGVCIIWRSPEFCVCDLVTCDLPAVPACEDGLQPVLTNPGECRPTYTCACKQEECKLEHVPSCPPHRELTVKKTQCCDEYECTCSCTNSTVSCPAGYLSTSVTNDCGCTTTTCIADKGYTYVSQEGECCGKCQKTMCEEQNSWSRGDVDVRLHEVGTVWRSPFSPCIVNKCVRVNDEVFVEKRNVSCSHMDTPTCHLGYELRCDRITNCCPSCRCGCFCAKLTALKSLQPNETIQDGCDSHSCKVNEKREFIWEKRITGCPPFDSRRCLAEGGKIAKIDNTCCETCIEAECRQVSSRLTYLNINGCEAVDGVLIFQCEGKCRSKTKYSIEMNRLEDECTCCSATQTVPVNVPLRCANGTVVQHEVPSAVECECFSRQCT